MSSRDQIRARLKLDEGTGPMKHGRFLPYFDCCGKVPDDCECERQGALTIGYGHNLEAKGITAAIAERLLDEDIDDAARGLVAALPWVADLDPVRQAVLVMMAFQLGVGSATSGTGLLGFRRTLKAIEAGAYDDASVSMLESKWSHQVPKRAMRLAEMMASGRWPA